MTFTETVSKTAKVFSAIGSVTNPREGFKLSVIMDGKELKEMELNPCISGNQAKNWKHRRFTSLYIPIVTAETKLVFSS